MADYDPAWGQRMMQRYGATEADLADPDQRRNLNRRAREEAAGAQPAPAAPAPAPATGGAETKPTTPGAVPNQPGQWGGVNPLAGSAGPGGYGPPPPASGYGYAIPGQYYGGPGTAQPRGPYGYGGGYRPPAAGYRGAANYPQPGNTYPLPGQGPGARPGFPGYGGYGGYRGPGPAQAGPDPYQMQMHYQMNQPPPGAAYDALAGRM